MFGRLLNSEITRKLDADPSTRVMKATLNHSPKTTEILADQINMTK
jgi:hypothetical protein